MCFVLMSFLYCFHRCLINKLCARLRLAVKLNCTHGSVCGRGVVLAVFILVWFYIVFIVFNIVLCCVYAVFILLLFVVLLLLYFILLCFYTVVFIIVYLVCICFIYLYIYIYSWCVCNDVKLFLMLLFTVFCIVFMLILYWCYIVFALNIVLSQCVA